MIDLRKYFFFFPSNNPLNTQLPLMCEFPNSLLCFVLIFSIDFMNDMVFCVTYFVSLQLLTKAQLCDLKTDGNYALGIYSLLPRLGTKKYSQIQ